MKVVGWLVVGALVLVVPFGLPLAYIALRRWAVNYEDWR
jgi:hypothetical protein